MLYARRSLSLAFAVLVASTLACTEKPNSAAILAPDTHLASVTSTGPTVTSTFPFGAARGTTLDVQINGSGFDASSRASFELHGVIDPRVRVNSTRYVKSTQVVANLTIAADATVSLYDVGVALASGKKGIGTEQFEIALKAEVLLGVSAQDVNSSGDVAGNYATGGTCPAAGIPPTVIVVVHLDGTRAVLPMPSSGLYCHSQAHAINNSGQVMGRLEGITGVPSTRAIWTPSGDTYTIRELGPTPDGFRPYTSGGFNNLGQVIGWTNGVPNVGKVYWWSETTGWLPMAVPAGATRCNVYNGINDREEIVGKCVVGGVTRPYYWQNHTATPIAMPTQAGVTDPTPQDINNSGVVVGYSPALRWTPNGPGSWIAEKLPDAGKGSSSYRITDDGSIAGSVSRSIGNFGAGPLPVYWQTAGSYHLLAPSSGTWSNSGAWGESNAVAMTPIGIVAIGSDHVAKGGLRWRAPPLP
jgi:hypothetical protein